MDPHVPRHTGFSFSVVQVLSHSKEVFLCICVGLATLIALINFPFAHTASGSAGSAPLQRRRCRAVPVLPASARI